MSKRTSKGQVTNETVSTKPSKLMGGLPSASEIRELIASRAYELYEHRGAEFGDELTDWLQAEEEVVTMLLAEPQELARTETPNGRPATRAAGSARTAKSVNGVGQRAARPPKRNNIPKVTPA